MYKSFSDVLKEDFAGLPRGLDSLGRVVIPKEHRRKLGWEQGCEVEIFCTTDGVYIRKAEPSQKRKNPAGVHHNLGRARATAQKSHDHYTTL